MSLINDYKIVFTEKRQNNLSLYEDAPIFSILKKRNLTLDQFANKIKACHLCKRYVDCKSPVPFTVNDPKEVKYLFMGKEPSLEDLNRGKLLNEKANYYPVFKEMLRIMGIGSNEYIYTNVVHCHGKNYRNIEYDEYLSCVNLKLKEFDILNRDYNIKYVFLLGNDAVQFILGRFYSSLKHSGFVFPSDVLGREYKFIPLPHPVFLFQKKDFIEDTYAVLDNLYREVLCKDV